MGVELATEDEGTAVVTTMGVEGVEACCRLPFFALNFGRLDREGVKGGFRADFLVVLVSLFLGNFFRDASESGLTIASASRRLGRELPAVDVGLNNPVVMSLG
jgi:hypothetical protein